jgi:hypothetical protein
MAEYFVQRADGAYTDVSATHVPSNEPTPDEYEPSLVPKGPVADDTHTSAAEEQYEVTTDYSLDGYAPIDSVIQEAPMGHGVAQDFGAEGRPYPDASVPDIFEDLPRQNAEISGVNFEAEDPIIEGTEIDSGEVRIEPIGVQEGRSLAGYEAIDSVVEQAPLGYGVPQWYGRAEGSAGDQVVSWEDDAGVSSPSMPPTDIFWAESKKERMSSGKAMHYAIPSEKKYPIWDKAHARMALAWSRGTKYADRVEKAVVKRFPVMSAESADKGMCEAAQNHVAEYHGEGCTCGAEHHKGQGYDDQQDESIGERHQGAHEQSLKDRRDEADAMDRKTGRKYHDVGTMDQAKTCPKCGIYGYWGAATNCPPCGGVTDMDALRKEVRAKMGSEHHKGQGYDDEMDESLGMRHRGRHSQSFKDRRNEAAAMDKRHSRMGRKYDDVAAMDADSFPANRIGEVKVWMCHRCGGLYHVKEMAEDCLHGGGFKSIQTVRHSSEHHKGQGYDDELDESLGMSHKESGMRQSFKDRRDESAGTEKFDDRRKYSRVRAMDAEMDGGEDWNMGLTQYAGSAGGSGQGTPVSYGGMALPESAVASLVESSTDNPLDATMGTVMGTMGAETIARKKSKKPAARQRGRAATQGTENDPCAKSDRACPKDKGLWQRSKQRASKEYRVWPSPHASAYAVQLYNEAGGKWSRATKAAHPKAKAKNLAQNSLGNYYGGKYERGGDKGAAVDFSTRKSRKSSKGSALSPKCGRAYTKDMTPEEFRKSFPRCLPKSGAKDLTSRGQRKETLKKRAKLNKRKFRGGKGVSVPVKRNKSKK